MPEEMEREVERARAELAALIVRVEDASQAPPGRDELAARLGKAEALVGGARRTLASALRLLESHRAFLRGIASVVGVADAQEILDRAMDGILLLSGAERGFLVLRDGPAPFDVRVARNVQKGTLDSPEFEISRGLLSKVMTENRTLILVDATREPEFQSRLSVLKLKLLSVLAVPLRSAGRVIGAVYLDNRRSAGVFREEVAYLVEEFASLVSTVLEGARRRAELEAENRDLARQADGGEQLLGQDERWRAALEMARQAAPTDLAVLITGESGTGKELVARMIHRASRRQRKPFVTINCAALPKGIAESELFGHAKGSFTGADAARRGRVESAAGGTLFLDEVESLDIDLQGKLLRLLQFGEVQRVGSDSVPRVDVRVIAASNQELGALVEQGRFRGDLFYRLGVATVSLPPLRERIDDIELLAVEFVRSLSRELGRAVTRVEKEALTALRAYPFPGNVRELQNVLRRAILASRGGAIRRQDLPVEILTGAPRRGAVPPATREEFLQAKRRVISELERRFVEEAIRRGGGNISHAAAAVGMDRSALSVLARKHRLSQGKQRRPTR